MNQFRYAQEKYEEGKRALKAAEDLKPEENMLLPLSNALYIQGSIDNVVNVPIFYLWCRISGFT